MKRHIHQSRKTLSSLTNLVFFKRLLYLLQVGQKTNVSANLESKHEKLTKRNQTDAHQHIFVLVLSENLCIYVQEVNWGCWKIWQKNWHCHYTSWPKNVYQENTENSMSTGLDGNRTPTRANVCREWKTDQKKTLKMHNKTARWCVNTDNVCSLNWEKTKTEENTTAHFSTRGGRREQRLINEKNPQGQRE